MLAKLDEELSLRAMAHASHVKGCPHECSSIIGRPFEAAGVRGKLALRHQLMATCWPFLPSPSQLYDRIANELACFESQLREEKAATCSIVCHLFASKASMQSVVPFFQAQSFLLLSLLLLLFDRAGT